MSPPVSSLSNDAGFMRRMSFRRSLECGIFHYENGTLRELTPGAAQRFLGRQQTSVIEIPGPIQTFLESAPSCSKTLELHRPNGEIAHLQVCLVNLDPSGGAILVVHDLTATEQVEVNLEHLNRLASLGAMAAGMAHEIKNSLVAGKTFVDLLLEKDPEAELAQVVRRELRRIDSMVGQMLRQARPTTAVSVPFHAHDIINQVLHLIQPQLEDKAVQLKVALDAPVHRLHGDPSKLQQALLNLLLNATEAVSSYGAIQVETTNPEEDGELLIHITDDGPGMTAEALQKLFTPFYTTKSDGTGLGLVISRRIVEEHGGAVRVESEPNKGARFTVCLPVYFGT